jgi:hypothetical protein
MEQTKADRADHEEERREVEFAGGLFMILILLVAAIAAFVLWK